MRATLVLGSLLFACPAHAAELELADVLAAVEKHHPLIAAELASVRAAEADAYAARGEFDTTVSVQGRIAPAGYYDPKRAELVVEQPTPFAGASLYAGYRIGRGNIAPYYGEQRTLDGGELRGGARIPLLQDRAIDARRAGLRSSALATRASEASRDKVALDLERDAASAYFAWVAAGLKLQVSEDLLALAETRKAQIAEKVSLGALPPLEALDNERTILERTRQRVTMRRAFEKASIDLSLFLRDAEGMPRIPSREDLPATIAETEVAQPTRVEAEQRALSLRPELSQLSLQLDLTALERELGQNRLLPRLDVFAEASKDFGGGPANYAYTLRPTVFEAGVSVSVPIWLRKARGKLRAVEQKLEAGEHKLAFAREKARADVQDAYSQLAAARERLEVALRAHETALRVANGERERFEFGASTVLFVNLREQATADAHLSAIDARAELGFAHARVTLATGTSLRARK
ncbi:MAG TPA: TolC family protein [Polyangiales bacterium]